MQEGNNKKDEVKNEPQKPTLPKRQKEKDRKSWREHKNPFIRYTAKTGYSIWLVVMLVGGGIAIILALALL